MERKISLYRAGLGIAFIACALLCLDCSDALLEEMKDLAAEASRPSILPADGATITAHETITLVFKTGMAPSDVSVSGTMGSGSATWGTTSIANDTLVLNAANAVSWNAGSSMKLVVTVSEGGESSVYEYGYAVFDGTCVADPSASPSSADAGTILHPFRRIQQGIDLAKSLYITSGARTAAEVRVATGTYSAACQVQHLTAPIQAAVYVVDMVAGVSLYGGYPPSDFGARNIGLYPTILADSLTTGGAYSLETSDPVRTVNCTDSGVGNTTALDGFTIQLAKGINYHTAVFCYQSSPTLSNLIIAGSTDATSTTAVAMGILLNQSSARIVTCTVSPGYADSTDGNGGIAYGIRCTGSSTPSVLGSTVSGGTAETTCGILLEGGASAQVTSTAVQGGTWQSLYGKGYCVMIKGSTTPILEGLTLSVIDTDTYGIFCQDAGSQPASLTDTSFSYNGNWYRKPDATVITSANAGTVNVVTGQGTDLLFNTTWGNTHL